MTFIRSFLTVLLIAFLLSLHSSVNASDTPPGQESPTATTTKEEPTPSPLIEYENADDFQQRVKESDLDTFHLVKFFAPWCGHCQRLEPTWKELAQEYNINHPEKNVHISRVDCTKHGSICSAFGVRGYPSLYAFWNGEVVDEYRQSRALDSIKTYVEHMTKPVVFNDMVLRLTESLYNTETARRGSTWLILVEDEDKYFDDEEVKTVANNFRGSNVMVAKLDCTKEPELCKKFSKVAEKPAAVLLRAGGYIVSNSARSAVALKQFAEEGIVSMSSGSMSNKFPRPGVEGMDSGNWTAMILAIIAGIVIIAAFFLCIVVCLYLEDESEEDERDGSLTGKDLGPPPSVSLTSVAGSTKKGLKKD